MHNGELCQGSAQKHMQDDGNDSNEMEIIKIFKKKEAHIVMYACANSHLHKSMQIPKHLHE